MPRTFSRIRTPACDAAYSACDDLLVDERVHLREDLGGLARLGAPLLALDELQEPPAQAGRRHDQLLQARRIRVAGEGVEERRASSAIAASVVSSPKSV